MNRNCHRTAVATGLVLLLGGTATWGSRPLTNDTSDGFNTGGGYRALEANTSGYGNTAYGSDALSFNTTGFLNTAFGFVALTDNTTGSENTAIGSHALQANNADYNTATGSTALFLNSTGRNNTADGAWALLRNTTGSANTASGADALEFNTTGNSNTANGAWALYRSTTSSGNTASGFSALLFNTTGNNNTAMGFQALKNSTGSGNIALGMNAGVNLTSGNNNVYLGNGGVASESSTLRLGGGQTRTFIAGIAGKALSGSAVVINSSGQLGVVASSARYKRDIETMGPRSQDLMKLRPVTFRYKDDGTGLMQYGLIAEEVAKVYPELVVRKDDGTVESVQYHELTAMLLNELQHQQQALEALKTENNRLKAELAQQNTTLAARLTKLEATVRAAGTFASR